MVRTPDEVEEMLNIFEVRKRFEEAAKEQYPNTGYPVLCWLFDQVLGMDPRSIAAEPISKKQYTTFIIDEQGQRMKDPQTGKPFRVKRKFTPEQQKSLREWWPLLPDSMIY